MSQSTNGLLGYGLRKAARLEMLGGGVRLAYLVAQPSPIKYIKSEDLDMTTPREEREGLELEYEHIGQRLLPVNIGQRARVEMCTIRSKDVYKRFLANERAQGAFVPRAKDLTILPLEDPVTKGVGASVFGVGKRFMPMQVVKPKAGNWAPAVRGSGVRSTRQQLFQERLDGKGFGWKRKARSLWQQDVDTNGFRPHRYF